MSLFREKVIKPLINLVTKANLKVGLWDSNKLFCQKKTGKQRNDWILTLLPTMSKRTINLIVSKSYK